MNIDDLVAQWQSQWNDWKRSIEADNTAWTTQQRNAFTTWITQQEAYFNDWKEEYTEELTRFKDTSEADFNTWFDHMKGQLSTDAAGHLQTQIDTIVQNEIPAIKTRLNTLENDNDKTIINTKYIGQNLYLSTNSFPFSDEDFGKYFEIGGLYVKGVQDTCFNSAIVRVYKADNGSKFIAAVISNNAEQQGYSHYAAYMTSNGTIGIESILVEKKIDKVNEVNNSNYDSTDKYLSAQGASRLSVEGYDTDLGSKERINPTSIIPYTDRYVLKSGTRQRNLARMSGKEIALYLNRTIFDTAYNMTNGVIADAGGRYSDVDSAISAGVIINQTNMYNPTYGNSKKRYGLQKPLVNSIDYTGYNTAQSNELTADSYTSWEVVFPKPIIAKRDPSNSRLISISVEGLPSNNKVTATLENGNVIAWNNIASRGSPGINNLTINDDNIYKIKKIKIELNGRYSSSRSIFYLFSIIIYGYPYGFNSNLPLYLKTNNVEKKVNLNNINDIMDQCVNMFIDRNEWWPIAQTFKIRTGIASDGDVLQPMAGYKNHKYIVSPREGNASLMEEDQYGIKGAGSGIICYINESTRVITSKIRTAVQRDSPSADFQWTSKSISVNYMEIAF